MGPPGYSHLCLIWLHLRGFHNPLLRLKNWLEWLIESRKGLYLLLLLYYTGCKWTARWRDNIEWGLEGSGASVLIELGFTILPAPAVFTNPEAVRTALFRVFVKIPLCRFRWFNHWPLVMNAVPSSSPLPGSQGWDWKFQLANHRVGLFGNKTPSSKSYLISIDSVRLKRAYYE